MFSDHRAGDFVRQIVLQLYTSSVDGYVPSIIFGYAKSKQKSIANSVN